MDNMRKGNMLCISKALYYGINIALIAVVFKFCHYIAKNYLFTVNGYLISVTALFITGVLLSYKLIESIYNDKWTTSQSESKYNGR